MALYIAASACLLNTTNADAQAADSDPQHRSDYHDDGGSEIVVTASVPTTRMDALSGVAILRAEELTAALRPAIGETLQHMPGVSATSFGPTASRPVLRGLQGERVRVLTNGIGSIDVSNTSVDHAAAVNPLLAKRIEVLRGPQSLLYGSAAIGGVVNVIDGRIPDAVPDEPVHLGALAGYSSAASDRSVAGTIDAPMGGGWVVHGDGSWNRSDDLRIGGYALTPALRAAALASGDPFAEAAGVRDKLPNSASRTWNAGLSAAYIGDAGNIGVGVSRYDSRYGVPIRFAVMPGQDQETPTIHLRQDRADARVELSPGGALIDKAAFRFAFADYRHAELDPQGRAGTVFSTQGMEGRLELTQVTHGGWSGASGMQFVLRKFDVTGEEAYLPANRSDQLGLFSVQQVAAGPWRIEAGLRWETTSHKASPLPDQPQFARASRRMSTLSGSLGASYEVVPGWKLGLTVSRAERAPAAEELFANGPHAGTASFEIGDPDLRTERANSAEMTFKGGGADLSIELSAYASRFSGFIFERRTGELEDGLPVYQIAQAPSRHYGFEGEARATLARFGPWTLRGDVLADYVHATIKGEGPAPRIPPLRVLGGLTLGSQHLDLRGEVERVTAQDRTAPFETRTPGYTMVNAEIDWRPWGQQRPLSVVAAAGNLFDVVARRHASYLKDYAPLAGRDLRLTLRLDI